MKKTIALIAALLIALLGMTTMALAEDAFMETASVAVEEMFFAEAPEMNDTVEMTDDVEMTEGSEIVIDAPAAAEALAETEDPAVDLEIAALIVEETAAEREAGVAPTAEFMVTYLNWDNEEILSALLGDGETVEELAFLIPVREGYTFEHWYDEQDEEQAAYAFGYGTDRDLVLKAFFTQNPMAVVETEVEMAEQESHVVPAAQAEESEVMDILENDVDGLEIVIIKDSEMDAQEETAEEGAVLIEEDDEEGDMVILEDDEAEELTMEDDAVPLAGPAMVAIDRQVNVRSSLGNCVSENDTVTLTGELIGFDGCDVMLQWQVFDGASWQNIDGANATEYNFSATNESVNSTYRLAVAING